MNRRGRETAALVAAFVLCCLALAWMGAPVDETRAGEPAPEPIVTRVSLDSLLAAEASAVRAPGASPAGHEPVRGSAAVEATVEGEAGDTTPAPATAPSTAPHLLTLTPDAPEYAALAACGVPCWGARLTAAEVEALALAVSGDASWSAWAAWCFTGPRESGGYVSAVGGPNVHPDGGVSWDVGVGQSNTRTLAGLGFDAARVLTDVEYAMRALYATWQVQGVQAWFGCGGGE